MSLLARHYRLLLSAGAVVLAAWVVTVWATVRTVVEHASLRSNRITAYRWQGMEVAAWIPAVAWWAAGCLLALALFRRRSTPSWWAVGLVLVVCVAVWIAFSFAPWPSSGGAVPPGVAGR